MMRAILFSCVVCLTVGVAVSARADDCALALTAAIAQAKTPHAVTHVTAAPGRPSTSVEMIFMSDKAYMQMNGAWRSIPYTPQQQIDIVTAAIKRAEQTTHRCQKLASEPVNGEAASLLVMRSEANGKTSENRFWISDKTGLPLKSEMHLASGAVATDDFRYDDIKAPPGVD